MIALRLCWPIFAVFYMCQGTTPHLISTQMIEEKVERVNGVRYKGGSLGTCKVRSMVECALLCVQDKSCSDFNFSLGQCELLSSEATCRTNAPEWTHGYRPTSKYQTKLGQPPQFNMEVGHTSQINEKLRNF